MFTEDLATFFDPTDFGTSATWSGSNSAVEVIFDNGYFETLQFATRQPQVWIRDAQLPGVTRGDTLAIDGATYTVVGIEPDGTGLSMLRLEKVG